jgi:acyl-CoA synthetase (NDP forming)
MQGQLPTTPDDTTDHTIFSDVVAGTDKPVIAYTRVLQNVTADGLAFQAKAGLPFVQTLPAAVRSLQALIKYSAARDRGVVPLPESTGARASLEGVAFEELLAQHGMTPPASAMGATAQQAATEAAKIGFPVALKIVSPQASHKTEVGGVALGLADEAAVVAAADEMAARLAAIEPDAVVDGFLVQEMVSGVEMILGVREDPQFGPFMVAGLGGVMVEAMRDIAFHMLPLMAVDAEAMLDELRGKALLGEFRGRSARDIEALVTAMVGLSALFLDHRTHLADLEVNPLIVGGVGEGVRAVDVRPVFK